MFSKGKMLFVFLTSIMTQSCFGDHRSALKFYATLLETPEIFLHDNHNEHYLKVGASCSALANSVKVIESLFDTNYLGLTLIADIPQLLIRLLTLCDDGNRYLDASIVADINKKIAILDDKRHRNAELFLLVIELITRGIVCTNPVNGDLNFFLNGVSQVMNFFRLSVRYSEKKYQEELLTKIKETLNTESINK